MPDPIIYSASPSPGSVLQPETAITFDVLDIDGGIVVAYVSASYPSISAEETIYDGLAFGPQYLGTIEVIGAAWLRFHGVIRRGGWVAPPSVKVTEGNDSGNIKSEVAAWLLAPASVASPAPLAQSTGFSAEAYARQLKQLLPRGRVWNLEPGSLTSKVLLAIGEELARVSGRAGNLLDELDPRTALELLNEYEQMLGLPDDCMTEIPISTTERRVAVAAKLAAEGGQTPEFYIALAANLGFADAVVTTFPQFRSGHSFSGDRCYGLPWAQAWRLDVPLGDAEANYMTVAGTVADSLALWAAASRTFRSGSSFSGDRLVGYGSISLECAIRRAAPAHTVVLFGYT